MKKIVLAVVAVLVCLVGVTAIRAISAATNSPIAALLPANINSSSLVQTGDRVIRVSRQPRTLTFAERVTYQRAIEEVYWRHRIWPKENSNPKPSLDAVTTQAQLEKEVTNYLTKSQALEHDWHRPITADQLQAEMDRMAQTTNQPDVSGELLEARENDPFVIAECLARPVLTERLLSNQVDRGRGQRAEIGLKESSPAETENQMSDTVTAANSEYSRPTIADVADGCRDDTWTATAITNAPTARDGHTAVWTGSEMIVWGGFEGAHYLNTGGRYNPATDSWVATGTANAPQRSSLSHSSLDWNTNDRLGWF